MKELRAIIILGYGILAFSYGLLGINGTWPNANQWLVQAGILWGFVGFCSARRLHLNRPHEQAPSYSQLGWANRVTIARGGFIALTGGFLWLVPSSFSPYLPALTYGIAAILDRIDGYVARRTHQVSLMGRELDTTFDALGLVVAPLLAVSMGKLPVAFLAVSAAYYVYQAGLQWRRRHHFPLYPIVPNFLRRTLAGFQMGFVALILWPFFDSSFTRLAGVIFMIPILTGFIFDWLVVCGYIKPDMPNVRQFLVQLEKSSWTLLQPGVRLWLAILSINIVVGASPLFMAGWCLGLVLLLLGIIGRLGALILLVLLSQLETIHLLAVIMATGILLFGTGRFSLWQWDDVWVKRYDGA